MGQATTDPQLTSCVHYTQQTSTQASRGKEVAIRKSLLDVQIEETDPSTIVRVAGVLDISTIEELENRVRPYLRTDAEVIVDFSGVTLCDSTGLGTVVKFDRQARAIGCSFAVRSPRPHVAEVFAMTGIDQVVRVYHGPTLNGE